MYNVLAAATASAAVLLSTSATLACEHRTVAAIQDAAAPKVLLAQATQQENPPAQSGREAQSDASVGNKSASPATSTTSAGQSSVLNQPSVVKQKEEAQKLGQEVK
jgi:RES domain-containing protein